MEPLNKTNKIKLTLRTTSLFGMYVSPDSFAGYTTSYNGGSSDATRTAKGYKNPQWRDQVRQVVDATTPFTGKCLDVLANTPFYISGEFYGGKPYDYTTHRNFVSYGDLWSSSMALPVVPSEHSDLTTADNRAIAKLYDTLQSFQGTQSTGEDLGEIGQTLRMLSSPMKGLRRTMVDLMSRHSNAFSKKSTKAIAKALADTTLEYKFGVKPLVDSITGVVLGLQNRDYLYYYYPFNCVGGDDSATVSIDEFFTPGNNVLEAHLHTVTRTETTVKYKGVWGVSAAVPQRQVSDILGTRFQDIVPTVWNLIPYSWMIDYVSNIGVIAQAISVPWSNVRWCSKTSRTLVIDRKWLTPNFNEFRAHGGMGRSGKWVKNSLSGGVLTTQGKYVTRSSQNSLPIPAFEVKPRASIGHIVNLGALLASKLLGIRSKTSSAVRGHSDLPHEFQLEMARRGEKIPFPFH